MYQDDPNQPSFDIVLFYLKECLDILDIHLQYPEEYEGDKTSNIKRWKSQKSDIENLYNKYKE